MNEPSLISLFVQPLNELRIPYLVTGGVASVMYGEPRLTRDIDLVIALNPRDAQRFARAWPDDQFYVPPVEVIVEESERSAHGHFNVIHHHSTMRADVYLPGEDPLNRWAFANSVTRRVDEIDVVLAPVEAVILSKLRYFQMGGSDRHLRDIRQMLTISGPQVDHAVIERWTHTLGVEREWQRALEFNTEG